MWEYNNAISSDELYHYGVLGMKWHTHRISVKTRQNTKLTKKSAKWDLKSAKAKRKSDKAHWSKDDGLDMNLSSENRNAAYALTKKANKYNVKSKRAEKKSLKAQKNGNTTKQLRLAKKAKKLAYKAAKKEIAANEYLTATGYGPKAIKYLKRSDKFKGKVGKANYKIANNNYYIHTRSQKIKAANEVKNTNGSDNADD